MRRPMAHHQPPEVWRPQRSYCNLRGQKREEFWTRTIVDNRSSPPGNEGTCHSRIAPATLVTLALAHSIQTRYDDALHTHGKVPNIVVTTANSLLRSGLWSSTTILYVTPRLRTKFDEQAFSNAGPAAWNSLPANIRAEYCQANFKKLLKTHLFSLAFPVDLCFYFSRRVFNFVIT